MFVRNPAQRLRLLIDTTETHEYREPASELDEVI